MPLPVAKTEPSANIDTAFWLLYGPPGIGKSSLAASFPNTIFGTTERAHRHLSIFERQLDDWSQVVMFADELRTKDGAQYQTVAFDTVDLLFKMCLEYVCLKKGFEHPADEAYGKGYDAVNSEFQKVIIKFTQLGKGVFFISHAKEKEVTARNIKYTKTVPTMPGGCFKILSPLVDFQAYMGFSSVDVKERCVIFEPREHLEAKDRFGKFPAEVLLPKDDMYGALTRAWNGEKPKPVRRVIKKT